MDSQTQQQFIAWLGDKLQAKDQGDLQKKLQTLGDDGIRKAYDQFTSEKSDADDNQEEAEDNGVQSNKLGGQLHYIKCLQAFAKGGHIEMEKCGCGGKMAKGGELVNRGSVSIKKDKGSIKDSDNSKIKPKGQKISHGYDPAEMSDKPTKGKKKEMKKGGLMQADIIGKDKKGGRLNATEGFKKGGKAEEMKTGARMEFKKGGMAKKAEGGTLTSTLLSLARGGRVEEGGLTQSYPHGIKDPNATPPKLKGKRKDIDKKEANPGKKQYLDKGDTKQYRTAVTKVPTGATGTKLQGGGSMAGTMGGMIGGAGVKNPNSGSKLVKKKMKVGMMGA